MGLRIHTNVAAIAAQRQLESSQRKAEGAMKSLASGSKFSDPNHNAADFVIAEHLRGQISGTKAARMNAENANSMIQVAEGGLNEQNNILIRMRELAIQASSDNFGDNEREMLNSEFTQISQEFDRIAQTTSFGKNKLLNGNEKTYEFQVGAYGGKENIISYKSNTNTSLSEMSLDGVEITDKSDARDALDKIDEALNKIGQSRADFGAIQSRLNSVVSNASNQIENLENAHSKMADTDVAEAVSEMAKNQAMLQYQVAVLQQANSIPGQIVKLIA